MLVVGKDYIEREEELKESIDSITKESRESVSYYRTQIEVHEQEIKKLKKEKNKVQKAYRDKKKEEEEKLYRSARDYFLNHIWEKYRYDIYGDIDIDEIEKVIDRWVNRYSRDEIQTALDMSFERYYEKDGDGVKAFEYVTRIAYNRQAKFWIIPRECLSWVYQNEGLNVRHVSELINRPIEKVKRLKEANFIHGMPISDAEELKEISSVIIEVVEGYKKSEVGTFKEYIEEVNKWKN